MSVPFANNQKKCATCSNWGGSRIKSSKWAKTAEVPSQTEKGECFLGQKHIPYAAIQTCNKFELWAALR